MASTGIVETKFVASDSSVGVVAPALWRSPDSYLSHLLGVTALVLEDGGTEEEAIAALLHDAVEDQGGEAIRLEIERRFGLQVSRIVEGCTVLPALPTQSWRSHKECYLHQLRHASPAVLRVVLADKLHNGRSLLRNLQQFGTATWQHFRGTPSDILWLHWEWVALFSERKPGWMAVELERVVEEMEHTRIRTEED